MTTLLRGKREAVLRAAGESVVALAQALFLLPAAVALAGCVLAVPGGPDLAAGPTPAAADMPVGGSLGASLGGQFDPADRDAAYKAELDAVQAGERRTWRGPHGAFGFVDPGKDVYRTDGLCREYTQTVYLGGRAQSGIGLACHLPDGEFHIVS